MDDAASDSAETQKLLKLASHGDAAAQATLLARHRVELHAFVEFRLDARLRARLDPDDVVQEVHVEAVRRLGDYLKRRPMPFRHWLRKTAYQRLLILKRQHIGVAGRAVHREVRLPDRSSLALAGKLIATGSTPSQQLDRKEWAHRVQQALAQLADVEREILLMRNCEDMSYNEIADILDIEPATARKRHGRALIRLHQRLSGAWGNDDHE